MAAHRYWRILFMAGRQAAGDVDLGWVKFFETVDIDATVAANPSSVGGTAISGENYSASYLPAKSFNYANGETAAGWASLSSPTWGTTKWIGYDFGAGNAKDIVAYSIAYYSIYEPYGWLFQWSDDGSTWTTRDTVTGFRFLDGTSHFFRCPETVGGSGYRYWRVYASGTGTGMAIGEISLRSVAGGANLITSPYASLFGDSLYSDSSAYHPRKAIDGNLNALSYSFMAANTVDPHWWMADLGKKVSLAEVVMNVGDASYTRSSYKLQASNDRVSWDDMGTFPSFTAAYQQKTLLPAVAILTRRRPVIVSS